MELLRQSCSGFGLHVCHHGFAGPLVSLGICDDMATRLVLHVCSCIAEVWLYPSPPPPPPAASPVEYVRGSVD